MTKMDATDYAILELLKKDGRMSYSDIAERYTSAASRCASG